ncbi:mitochondrial 54S ribosomal protein mL41 [Aspergillus lucknowensis]|uniref:Uncharacterized protein n=1 Tax=Aspergillus lucknowensis TaxID=176173 RepID=A0ABR4LWG5_9EURO
MVRATQPLMARLRLTTKQVNGGYYKGNRTGSMGFFAKNGSYVIDWRKVRTYVVPENLNEFKLTPFVTKLMPPTKSKYVKDIERNGRTHTVERALEDKDFLDIWAADNGPEVIKQERRDQIREERERRRQEELELLEAQFGERDRIREKKIRQLQERLEEGRLREGDRIKTEMLKRRLELRGGGRRTERV